MIDNNIFILYIPNRVTPRVATEAPESLCLPCLGTDSVGCLGRKLLILLTDSGDSTVTPLGAIDERGTEMVQTAYYTVKSR